MTPTPQLFRKLIWSYAVLFGLTALLSLGFRELVPEALREAEKSMNAQTPVPHAIVVVILGIVWLGGAIVGLVGLYRFKGWARPFNLAVVAVSFLVPLLTGYGLASGWADACSSAADVLLGAILALAYFSPVSNEFEKG